MIELKAREHFKSFPWVTHGRTELSSDFFKKAELLASPIRFIDPPVTFSIIVPVPRESQMRYFRECLYGLLLQAYQNFEVIVVGHEDLAEWRSEFPDSRFRWTQKVNASYAQLVSEGARLATGSWIGFVRAEDVLSPVALFHFAREIHKTPELSLVYANEAGINDNATKIEGVYFKPDFSWFNLIHFNGIGRAWVVRKSALEAQGGFSDRSDSDHELFLRLAETEEKTETLPAVLYYRRSSEIPWSCPVKKMVEEHLERKGLNARVVNGDTWKIVPHVDGGHKVSVVICFKNRSDLTVKCLSSLRAQSIDLPLEVVLVDNQSDVGEFSRVVDSLAEFPYEWRVLKYEQPFNFADMNNKAIEKMATGDVIVLLNNDVEWTSPSALADLAAWVVQPWVGTVGAFLRYPNGNVQHGGFSVMRRNSETAPFIAHAAHEPDGAFLTREVVGSTFAAVAFRREVFNSVGGLRPLDYPNAFGDVVFNLECLRRGWKNLYLATVEGVHHESATRGRNFEFWEERDTLREYSETLARRAMQELRWVAGPQGFSLKSVVRNAVMDGITRVSARSRGFEALCRRVPRLDALLTNQR